MKLDMHHQRQRGRSRVRLGGATDQHSVGLHFGRRDSGMAGRRHCRLDRWRLNEGERESGESEIGSVPEGYGKTKLENE